VLALARFTFLGGKFWKGELFIINISHRTVLATWINEVVPLFRAERRFAFLCFSGSETEEYDQSKFA
jgi:hypothetical protein